MSMSCCQYALSAGYNPFDPIQDTESSRAGRGLARPGGVTTHSIRYRILKERMAGGFKAMGHGYNPFDPIQDTESSSGAIPTNSKSKVTTHSIRYRILKVHRAIDI